MHEPLSVKPEVISATTALEGLVNSNVYLFGHGTIQRDRAEAVINDGLYTKYEDLSSTALGLETVVDDLDAAEHDMALLQAWPHHNLKYIVILGIERLEGDQIPHNRYLQSVVQPRPSRDEYDETYGEPYVVDKKFVAGYFNMNDGTFTPNSTYDPLYDPKLLDTTVNMDIVRQRNPTDPLEWLGRSAVGDAVQDQVKLPSPSDDDIPDVW